MQQNHQQALADAVARVLAATWDPIGIAGASPDHGMSEYHGYSQKIATLLSDGADQQRLARHLSMLRTQSMGLRPNDPADQAVAVRLIDLTPRQ